MIAANVLLLLILTKFTICFPVVQDILEKDDNKEVPTDEEALGMLRQLNKYVEMMREQECGRLGKIWKHGKCMDVKETNFKFDPWKLIKLFERRIAKNITKTTKTESSSIDTDSENPVQADFQRGLSSLINTPNTFLH